MSTRDHSLSKSLYEQQGKKMECLFIYIKIPNPFFDMIVRSCGMQLQVIELVESSLSHFLLSL